MCTQVWLYTAAGEVDREIETQGELADMLNVTVGDLPMAVDVPPSARERRGCLCHVLVREACESKGYRVDDDPLGFDVYPSK